MSIDDPVFVIGTGRCGSTTLMDLIAYHPAFSWPSQYSDRWPLLQRGAAVSRVLDFVPADSRIKFLRYMPTHAEAYGSWDRSFPGFAEPFRDLRADDVTPRARQAFRQMVADISRYQRKPRFITKFTGWSRIEFLKSIFPEAKFIHLVRDGRAVAYSWTTVPWWDGWKGLRQSRWGHVGDDILDIVARYDHSFIAIAAVHWKTLVNNISEQSDQLTKEDVLVLRYEDMVRDPVGTAYRSIAFSDLDGDDLRFSRHLRSAAQRIVDPDRKNAAPPWRANLTSRQIEMIDDICGEELARFDYL